MEGSVTNIMKKSEAPRKKPKGLPVSHHELKDYLAKLTVEALNENVRKDKLTP